MPYLSFPSLVDQVSHHRRRFTGGLSDVERILRGISSALEYLNERRIIHNNIKPGNILYDRGARGPILIDFGTATRHGDPVCHKGKCYYVPPEYYSRQNQRRGKEGDVFALGVIMLWLLDVMPLPDKDKEAPNFRQEKAWKNAAGNNAYMSSQWLDKISRQRSKLNKFGTESIVRNMLRFSPRQRITSGTLKEATSRAYQRDKS